MILIQCVVSNIAWEFDDNDNINDIPNTVYLKINRDWDDITDDEVNDIISDELSDRYGFLHNGFSIDELIVTKE
jgi:hypothetical protein